MNKQTKETWINNINQQLDIIDKAYTEINTQTEMLDKQYKELKELKDLLENTDTDRGDLN